MTSFPENSLSNVAHRGLKGGAGCLKIIRGSKDPARGGGSSKALRRRYCTRPTSPWESHYAHASGADSRVGRLSKYLVNLLSTPYTCAPTSTQQLMLGNIRRQTRCNYLGTWVPILSLRAYTPEPSEAIASDHDAELETLARQTAESTARGTVHPLSC